MNKTDKKMEVAAIKNGTVIDHIPSQSLFRVIDLLRFKKIKSPLIFANNMDSNKIGKKALIKIVDWECSAHELGYLALVAPQARVSTIRDYEVFEKRQIEPPVEVRSIVKCANPMCITNHEGAPTRFSVMVEGGELTLRCRYCEKTTLSKQIEIIGKK